MAMNVNPNNPPCSQDGEYILNYLTGRWIKSKGATARRVYADIPCVLFCGQKHSFTPLDYQIVVRDYFLQSQYPGILLDHSLGCGKSCSSIMIVDALLNQGYERAFVFLPGALRQNYAHEFCTHCSSNPNNANKLTYITTNYSNIRSVLPTAEEMSDSVIVIDEAHTVINGYRNGSVTYVHLFETLANVTGSRFILLTGTPITKDSVDMYYYSKLLAPDMFPTMDNYMGYINAITAGDEGAMEELRSLLQQIVSRVAATENIEDFPISEITRLSVPIKGEQLRQYNQLKEWEDSIIPPNERQRITNPEAYKNQKTRFYIAYSMIKSRQLCNMYYPPNYVSDADIDRVFVDNLITYAPKINAIVRDLGRHPGKHVVYSQFKTSHGVRAVAAILDVLSITYLMFTGDMDDADRARVSSLYNSETENLRGETFRVLLMTEAAAQGQNFLHVRRLHVLEESIDEFTILQVIGRVIRFRSHAALPVEERNIIVVRYFATTGIARNLDEVKRFATSDYDAYTIGQKRVERTQSLLDILNSLDVVPE